MEQRGMEFDSYQVFITPGVVLGRIRLDGRLTLTVGTGNPVLVSNLAVIAVSGSVSADLVRNIIFDELLRFDRLAPISVNQIHGHSVVNLIVQQGIAPVINRERSVSEVDQVEQENSCPVECLSAAIGYPRVRSKLILIPLEFIVDSCARIRGRRIGG